MEDYHSYIAKKNLASPKKDGLEKEANYIKDQRNSVIQLMPPGGYIKYIRTKLKKSRVQTANSNNKGVSEQSIYKFEVAEPKGEISLEAICMLAESLNHHVYYAFIKKDIIEKVTTSNHPFYVSKYYRIVRWNPNEKIPKEVAPNFIPKNGLIQCYRKENNLTLKMLGDKIDTPISAQAVSYFETSEANKKISIKSLKKIANAFGCEFIYGLEPKAHLSARLFSKDKKKQGKSD